MDNIQFVVYGAGYRGKRLLEYLGNDKVVAFIDSSADLVGKKYNRVPIIDLDTYKKSYSKYEIIVTPLCYKNINFELEQNKIYNYTNLNELPSEFSGYGKQNFSACYSGLIKKYDEPCYLYGKNAFGRLLYQALKCENNNVYWIDKNEGYAKGIVFVLCSADFDVIVEEFRGFKIIDAYDYSSNNHAYFNDKVRCMKNRYKDKKRCFIVATGPSLKRKDLAILEKNKEFTISMNRIYNIKPIWYPDIYVVTDSVLMKEDADKIRQFKCQLKFYSDANQPPDDDGEIIHCVATRPDEKPRFSGDVAQKVYGGCTVTYICIQLAVYLGFKEIYLLGVDCDYKYRSQNNHFYNVENDDIIEHNVDGMILAYQSAKQYAETHGIKIFNATRNGCLEVFERVDLDSIFLY